MKLMKIKIRLNKIFKTPNFRLKRKYNNSSYPYHKNKNEEGFWYVYNRNRKLVQQLLLFFDTGGNFGIFMNDVSNTNVSLSTNC